MAGVVLLARESGRAGGAAAALGWAVALLLLVDPAMVGDAGSSCRSSRRLGSSPGRRRSPAGCAARRGGRLPGWLAESLGVSFAAQAATLPVVLAGFGRFAVLAPVGQPRRRAARRAGDGGRHAWP